MKHIIILVLCFLMSFSFSVYGQDYYKINGKVINSNTKKPVTFASVSVQGSFVGVVTNEVGKFELKFTKEMFYDTLVISNMGYKTYYIPLNIYLNNADNFAIITLQAQDFYIKEVFITPEAKQPELIVKKAVKAIKNNYPKHAYYLDVFFRETEFNHNTFLRLTEAAIGIQDFGFDSDINRSRIKLLELRKSNDYLEYRTSWKILNKLFGDENILYETYYKDILRNHKNKERSVFRFKRPNSLDKKSIKYYNYSLHDIIFQDSSVIYIINYEPKTVKKSMEDTRPLIDIKGKLYIKKSDYAIVKLTVNYFWNDKKQNGYSMGTKTEFNYRKIKGNYYLNYLKAITSYSGTPLYKDKNSKQRKQMTRSSFYVTNIYTTKKDYDRVKRREKQQKDIDLYKKEIPYNEAFWESYNSVLRNPLMKKAKYDLEKEKELEEQFKDNG